MTLSTPRKLVPVHTNGRPPSYFIIAGLVFTPATVPYLRSEYGKEYDFGALVVLSLCFLLCCVVGRRVRLVLAVLRSSGRLTRSNQPTPRFVLRALFRRWIRRTGARAYQLCRPPAGVLPTRLILLSAPPPPFVTQPITAHCSSIIGGAPQVKLLDKMLHGQAQTPDQEVVVLSQARGTTEHKRNANTLITCCGAPYDPIPHHPRCYSGPGRGYQHRVRGHRQHADRLVQRAESGAPIQRPAEAATEAPWDSSGTVESGCSICASGEVARQAAARRDNCRRSADGGSASARGRQQREDVRPLSLLPLLH